MTPWQEITATALVGTERKPWQPQAGDRLLDTLLAKLSGEPASQVLRAAAILRLYDRAGELPVTPARDLPALCPDDPRPRCSPRAAWHLRSMLAGSFGPVLPEWLAEVIAAGQRIPEELVPDLLQAPMPANSLVGSASPPYGDLVMAAAGPLGKWLEMPNPHWQPAPDAVSVDWDTATVEERVSLLQSLRNSHPPAAIERIQSTWGVDKADQRAAFLRTLERGLGPLDEPFLETALDDKSIVVRRVAVDLLAGIPGSALLQRIAETARGCLTVARTGILRKKAIEVNLLSELPASLARDGVEQKGAPPGMGEKAWWTQQAIGLIPPSWWSEWLGMSAEDLVDAAAQGEDGKLLLRAWENAALRHSDARWARPLILAGSTPHGKLFALLAPADKEAVVLHAEAWTGLFAGLCDHAWSLAFTRTVAARSDGWPAQAMRSLGRFASIEYLDEIPADVSPGLQELAAVLRFRREMHQAIQTRQ